MPLKLIDSVLLSFVKQKQLCRPEKVKKKKKKLIVLISINRECVIGLKLANFGKCDIVFERREVIPQKFCHTPFDDVYLRFSGYTDTGFTQHTTGS